MRTLLVFIVLMGVCVVAIAKKAPDASPARFTAKVIDEDGKPLEGMSIVAQFYSEEPRQKGCTDSNGFFVAECKKAMLGEAGYSVNHNHRKSDYYESGGQYNFEKIVDGRWEPWSPVVTAVVRRIVNPISMYAKQVETMIPVTNSLCGYDLMVGDWVAPNGAGKISDMLFRVERTIVNIDDYNVDFKIVFTNRYDGFQSVLPFQKVTFTSPRFAPTNNYRAEYGRKMGRKPGRGSFNTDPLPEEYGVYRVRTVADDTGRIKSAYYGKITSGFRLAGYGAEKVTLIFTYYLNPTPNDRNLEFDPSNNLFKDLKDSERVSEP